MLLRIGIVLVALGVIGGVAGALIWGWDGPDHDRTVEYRIVDGGGDASDTGRVLVVDDGRWDGPPRFFPFFPLVVVGGVLITVGLVTRGGRGPGGWGGPRRHFDEWHREAHDRNGGPPSSAANA